MMLDKMSWESYQGRSLSSLSYRVDQREQHLVIGLGAKCRKPCLSAHYKARYQHFWLASAQSLGSIGTGLNYQVSSDL